LPDDGFGHPEFLASKTPIDQWSIGWLIMEVAHIIGRPEYMLMSPIDRFNNDLPASRQTMIDFIKKHRPDIGGKVQ
jgi:hypothetical protein